MNVFTDVATLTYGWLDDISTLLLLFLVWQILFLTFAVDVMDGFWVNDIIWR